MNGLLAITAACLLAQSEGKPLDPDATLDVSKVDQAPAPKTDSLDEHRDEFEALTLEAPAAATALELEPGASLRLPVQVTLTRPTSGTLVLRVSKTKGGRLEFGPMLSGVSVETSVAPTSEAGSTKKRRKKKPAIKEQLVALGHYFVRSRDAKLGPVREASSAELIELSSGAIVGRVRLEPNLTVRPPSPSVETIQRLEKAAQYFAKRREESEANLRKATGTTAPLSPEVLQPGRMSADSLTLVLRALEDAWRHEVALTRIRLATTGSSEPAVLAAMLAIGRLTPRADVSRAQSKGAPADELTRGVENVKALSLDRAELVIAGLRRRGDLTRGELALLLSLDGAVSAVRGQKEEAERAMGRSICLDPSREPPDPRPPIRTTFEAVKAAGRCDRALRVETPEAYITTVNGEAELHVRVLVGPDPYGVVAGGTVMLYGGGGGVIDERKVRAEGEGQRSLLAVFPNDQDLRNVDGELLVQAVAKDVSGVVLSSVGDPVPLRITVGEHEGFSEGLPWWVWVGGGLLVLAGAGVTTLVLLPRDEVRGIGPIDVSF